MRKDRRLRVRRVYAELEKGRLLVGISFMMSRQEGKTSFRLVGRFEISCKQSSLGLRLNKMGDKKVVRTKTKVRGFNQREARFGSGFEGSSQVSREVSS